MNYLTAPRALSLGVLSLSLLSMAPQRAAAPQGAAAKAAAHCEPRIAINQANTPGDADSLFRIATPGSYYLPQNTTGVPGKHGIEVASSDVSIDLMGFTLSGVPGSLNGVTIDGSRSRVRVHDGIVVRFGGLGVKLTASGSVAERLQCSDSGGDGLQTGVASQVRFVTAMGNLGVGVVVGAGSSVQDVIADENTLLGLYVAAESQATRCIARKNALGIQAGPQAALSACVASVNDGHGFRLWAGASARGCVANGNGSNGFWSDAQDVSVIDCKSSLNAQYGFHTNARSLLRGNLALRNGDIGVGGGFRVDGAYSVLEANRSLQNVFMGYVVPDGGNMLRGNVASNNALNWSVVPGNACRVIKAAVGIGVYGDAGGTAMGPDDPTANYTF